MFKIFKSNNEFKISSYEGLREKKKIIKLKKYEEDELRNTKWNFFRMGDNHAYVRNVVFYEGNCNNNVIISPYQINKLIDVRNAFIFIGDSFIEVSPIQDLSNALDKVKRISSQEITYNIPESVFRRENLAEKDLEELKKRIKQEYSITPENIFVINSGRTKNGIYHVKSEEESYILKFRGRNKEKAELLSEITVNIPEYFPRNFYRKNKKDFTFKIGDELYGLEELVIGNSEKKRNLEYFSLLGMHIGFLHDRFSNFIKKYNKFESLFLPQGDNTSESNLLSLYLDLLGDESNNKYLLSGLERIIEWRLNLKENFISKTLIHRDLNYSNLIWQGNSPKIIDSETIKISNRINEFESPLLFKGNMARPIFIKKSLKTMINSYNKSSSVPLSKNEIEILPLLLEYSLIKNFVIRNIRRGTKNICHNEVKRNLKLIQEEKQWI